MEWLPLELWRASSLAQETRTCEAAYERLGKGGNPAALATLRKSIEARIDELEAFFIENLDDERAVLFEKQVRGALEVLWWGAGRPPCPRRPAERRAGRIGALAAS